MIPETFFTFEQLASYGGATMAVLIITEFTKDLPGIRRLHTRLWAYLLAAVLLVLATVFTVPVVRAQDVLLCLINAVIVAMAAVGGYDTLHDEAVE
ncbi:MAG: hypothetical protein IJR17_06780 [Clostridia bacterium]|nr:hypothetical protein [Clostridia bacterium]